MAQLSESGCELAGLTPKVIGLLWKCDGRRESSAGTLSTCAGAQKWLGSAATAESLLLRCSVRL